MDTLRTAETLLSSLVDTTARATVILLLALAVTSMLQRSSAAMRHRVWALAMLSLILLPIASNLLPTWSVPILPATTQVETKPEAIIVEPSPEVPSVRPVVNDVPNDLSQAEFARSAERTIENNTQQNGLGASVLKPNTALTNSVSDVAPEMLLSRQQIEPGGNSISRPTIVVLLWGIGTIILAAGLALSLLKSVVLKWRSQESTDSAWSGLLAKLSLRLQLRRRVELREHIEPIIPLTCGVFRSVVLLPRKARKWTEPMKRSVLLHELAHVKRLDVASQMIARIAFTMFWFHPLAWMALRRVRQEGEQACDDAVIQSGERASDYADQLLQVAQLCCSPRGLSLGVAMAEGNSLEVRIKSLFDKKRSHDPVRTPASRAMLCVCAVSVAVVSVIRPVVSPVGAADLPTGIIQESNQPDAGANADELQAERTSSDSRIEAKDEPTTEKTEQATAPPRSPWLSVPKMWKADARDRIVKLCPEFGDEKNGLKLGIARPTGQTVFRMGDRIPIELFVMNVGPSETTFSFRCAPRVSYAPIVVDSNGHVVRGISGIRVFQPPYRVSLKPGEACSIPVAGLGIADQGASNFETPKPGHYELSYQVETLKSATIRFKVTHDDAGMLRLDVLDSQQGLRQGSTERLSILKPVFGKARREIQMGLGFASTRRIYSMGENIPIDLFFRNAGDTRTAFDFQADFFWSPPTVVNEKGERMHILPIPVWMYEGPTKVTLEPGHTFGIQTRGLGLRQDKSGLSLVAPTAGKYQIGFLRTIYDHLNEPGEWQEQLISGTLEIEVTDGETGVQIAKLLPGNPESLKALEADAKFQPQDSDSPPDLSARDLPDESVVDVPPPSEPKPADPTESALDKKAVKVPLDEVIWWEKVDGLQAGFLLDSPQVPNQRVPYNSVAKYRILVRNTTDKRLRFIARLLPHEGSDSPYMISSDDITEALAASKLPEKYRAELVPPRFKRSDPAYVISLEPGEAVFIPGQSGLDELSIFVGEVEKKKHPTFAKIREGMNWIVQPVQLQLFPSGTFSGGTSLMGRFKITRINKQEFAKTESASRMVASPGGNTLYPRIQLDIGTLTAAAERNAKNAKWGDVDKGLQCGIRLLNPEPSYVRGDMLEAELFWRNVSNTAISTPIPRKLDLYPIVHNAEGEFLPIDFGGRFNIYPVSLALKAGEVRSLGIFRIKLVKEGTPSPRSNAEPAHLTLEPGTYKLSGTGGVSAKDGGNPTSAKIEFIVISR